MRIAFMGTPAFAVPTLDALAAAGHEIAAVYCQPPRPAGRGKAPRPSPVQQRAEAIGLEVRTPATLRDAEAQARFADLDLDLAVVAAYGLILPAPILHAPIHGCINVHASLLPRWRGAAPVQRAILAGDTMTGVTIMAMARGLDTGPMLVQAGVAVDGRSAGELTDALAQLGATLLVRVVGDLGRYPPVPQPEEGVTYAAKIEKAEARLDFAQPAEIVARQVQAFNPAPGAFFEHKGERIRILAAEVVPGSGPPGTVADDRLKIACGERALQPTLVQRAGRGVMTPAEMLRGLPPLRNPAGVTRFRLTVEYDGRPFMGWQRQAHGPSVQAAIEAAALRVTGETATVHAAGRTDAGVHARAMAAHLDVAREIAPVRLMAALNALLRPAPIAILACEAVAGDWHARFSCLGRRYVYRIANRRAPLTLDAGKAWQVATPLDAAAMAAAAGRLVGRHDFTTFRSAHCQADSPVKTLDKLSVRRAGEWIEIEAAARSFLHHQVRSMVGCLALVGRGKWSIDDLAAALEARDRATLGLNAPPDGLYFVEAVYPPTQAATDRPSPNRRPSD